MFIILLVYFYTIIQLPINCILMGLITYFMFETQINYMWSLKKFKMNEILHATIFVLYVVLVFL
jgi:hypothetical protein